MIRLNVFISVGAENRAEFIEIAKELVASSQNDAGCIAYDLFESSTRPGVPMICETWTDDAALAAHEAAPHFVNLVPKMNGLAQIKIERFVF